MGSITTLCLVVGPPDQRLYYLLYCVVQWHPMPVEQMTQSAGNFDHPTCVVSTSPSNHTLFFTPDQRDLETPSSITVESDGYSTLLTCQVQYMDCDQHPFLLIPNSSRHIPSLHPSRYHRPPSYIHDKEYCIHTARTLTSQNSGWRPSGHIDHGQCKAIIGKLRDQRDPAWRHDLS